MTKISTLDPYLHLEALEEIVGYLHLPAPSLTTLLVTVCKSGVINEGMTEPRCFKLPSPLFASVAPLLRHVSLAGCTTSSWNTLGQFSGLTTLCLQRGLTDKRLHVEQAAAVLQHMPDLLELTLTDSLRVVQRPDLNATPETSRHESVRVQLSRLRYLSLNDYTDAILALLPWLSFPTTAKAVHVFEMDTFPKIEDGISLVSLIQAKLFGNKAQSYPRDLSIIVPGSASPTKLDWWNVTTTAALHPIIQLVDPNSKENNPCITSVSFARNECGIYNSVLCELCLATIVQFVFGYDHPVHQSIWEEVLPKATHMESIVIIRPSALSFIRLLSKSASGLRDDGREGLLLPKLNKLVFIRVNWEHGLDHYEENQSHLRVLYERLEHRAQVGAKLEQLVILECIGVEDTYIDGLCMVVSKVKWDGTEDVANIIPYFQPHRACWWSDS